MANSSKRKNVPTHHDNDPIELEKPTKKLKNKDHLRGSGRDNEHLVRNSNGTFKMQWVEGADVHLKLDDNSWVEAKIKSISTNIGVDPLKGNTSKLSLVYEMVTVMPFLKFTTLIIIQS